MSNWFVEYKSKCLQKLDRSNKGSVDYLFLPVVNLLNERKDICTTSCCSGRTHLFMWIPESEESSKPKKHNKSGRKMISVLNSHEIIPIYESIDQAISIYNSYKNSEIDIELGHDLLNPTLHFEPPIICMRVFSLDTLYALMRVASETAFRESGAVHGKNGWTFTFRSQSQSLRSPLGKNMFNENDLNYLITRCNKNMSTAHSSIDKLYNNLQQCFNEIALNKNIPSSIILDDKKSIKKNL